MRNWLLPEKFEDILPPQAQRIDRMRAKLLELFRVHGYELVIPPMLEYLESLLTGTGHDLDLRTFKLVDQLSGRMMGVRADIAPQVARIDAHLLNRHGGVGAELESELYEALEGKDLPALRAVTQSMPEATRNALLALPELYGDGAVLERARRALPKYPEIDAALEDLKVLSRSESIPVSVDLADLRGYHYHSGVVFAAYVPGEANAVALGGRYDEVGKAFGRARPATGFSMDLRDLARTAPHEVEGAAIRAPYSNDAGLATAVRKLRTAGEVVVVGLPGHEGIQPDCDRALVKRAGEWTVRKLGKS